MKSRALCLLREDLAYRRDAFLIGLQAVGYWPVPVIVDPNPQDVLIIWNRYGRYDRAAQQFEAAGAPVIVCENGWLGKDWLGDTWFSMALNHHGGAGEWRPAGAKRWDALDVRLEPWRGSIGETVILGQRGIGEPGIASPDNWAEKTREIYRGRIRPHPAKLHCEALEYDLRNTARCITWGSAAALHAIRLGIPTYYEMPLWIGKQAALPLAAFHKQAPQCDDAARLAMFRSVAWAMWRISEIESGAAFDHLLHLRA